MEMKRKRASGSGDGDGDGDDDGDGGVLVVLSHDLVAEEILTRVPSAKSLMRFKCVSKLWSATITDPGFCRAHRARSRSRSAPASLTMVGEGGGGSDLGFYTATLSQGGVLELRPQFTVTGVGAGRGGVTDVINGLFCAYTADDRACIGSISTGEIMELPTPPPLFRSYLDSSCLRIFCKYYLGFDSTHNEYKLLKVCTLQVSLGLEYDSDDDNDDLSRNCSTECAILTMGGSSSSCSWSWRVWLQDVPAIDIWSHKSVVYVDGGLYCWHATRYFLVAFSFQDEDFRLCPMPPWSHEHSEGSLHQYGGNPALAAGLVDRKLELWTLKTEFLSLPLAVYSPPLSEDAWTRHVVHIPYAFADNGCSLLGNLPTGEIFMTGVEEEIISKNSKSPILIPVFCSYNPTNGEFQKFVTGNKLPFTLASIGKDIKKFHMYSYEEDITPLNHLISNK